MNQKITVAVVGCGTIANFAHFPALSKMEDVRIKYACDLIAERAQEAVSKYGVELAVTDYHDVLADEEVDVVYVLTPNYEHYTISMAALQAGKHVFCEKPITVNYPLSCQMAETARQQNRLLNIGVCNRYKKTVEKIKELNDTGVLGNIYHVYCSFRSYRSIPGLGGPFTTKALSGGGVLIDWGVHFLDLILYILGGAKIRTVTADAYNEMAKDMASYKCLGMYAGPAKLDGTNDVEDYISGYIRTDKAGISFNGAWAQSVNKEEMYIDFMGDKAGVRMDYSGDIELFLPEIEGDHFVTQVPEVEKADMYFDEDRDFINAVKSGTPTRNQIESVLETAKLLDCLYESSDRKQEISF